MYRLFYSVLICILLPVMLLYLFWRGRKDPTYRQRWSERFGFNHLSQTGSLVIHCASVGEALAATPLIKQLLQQQGATSILVTCTSPTGSRLIQSRLGERVQHCYLPLDIGFCVKTFLRRAKPKAVILMETELWPNLIHFCHQQGVPVIVANARLSKRSANSYQKRRGLIAAMLNKVSAVAVQNQDDGNRFIQLGLAAEKLTVCGSLKFDLPLPENAVIQYQQRRVDWLGQRPVWIAGSVHPGEFATIIQAHQQMLLQYPELLLIMVPRHPEQFANATQRCIDAGLQSTKRSLNTKYIGPEIQVVIGDTMGELLALYGQADIAFVGGSLIERGGHNPLEPAALGCPTLMGLSYFNFQEIGDQLLAQQGMSLAQDKDQLVQLISSLLSQPQARQIMGQNAQQVVISNQGATLKQLAVINPFIR